ncbi:MAG: 5-amino-6-(D-ribitylamino)uracil--L-tyrosine 4-hydroxyphenyl transferase CofH [Arenicellales bacterium]|nr:5-amino-6-(D-ribitylamino)uracil--L-tyrosine 4-hydroxyphenyl transferase CofH [Arenicellales bacterium]
MQDTIEALLTQAVAGEPIAAADAPALVQCRDLEGLLQAARLRRDLKHGTVVSYSPKVFIPLTKLCRNVCHYCTFASPAASSGQAYLSVEQAIDIARAGADAGCHEALFTLGDQPELRYRAARDALQALGHNSSIDYLIEVAQRVSDATGLLPHVNPGIMTAADLARLRTVSVSAGLMLESSADRLSERGGAHHGCPDKQPKHRLESILQAGRQRIPFTSGILVGIGETRLERIESILALRVLHSRYGHLQEIIVQNFMPKVGTAMARAKAPTYQEHQWTIAVARLLLPPEISIQAPPNLSPGALDQLLTAGINDWGGVSPVTPDHVNPELPWPQLDTLRQATEHAGKELVARLPVYPHFLANSRRWLAPEMRAAVLAHCDGSGYAREQSWTAGIDSPCQAPGTDRPDSRPILSLSKDHYHTANFMDLLERTQNGELLNESQISRLFSARGREVEMIVATADRMREAINGDIVSYVINRNINYTNICSFSCRFCAFSKRTRRTINTDAPYVLDTAEIARRTEQAWHRGATEICLQGGIHPAYSGETYLEICRAAKSAVNEMHIHAFSPLEVWHGATTLGVSLKTFLLRLKEAGLGSLPGTAAEILDDEIRTIICADKISTEQWLEVMRTAHSIGLPSTATIMFGHIDGPTHWARHLSRVRALQIETGGFTEFVPLPFVHMEAPLYRKGWARPGPTFREAILGHAVARLVLHPHITNIQTSWVKMGPTGASACLAAGANDIGGTLMNESITRAAGATSGQELSPEMMEAMIRKAGRTPRQRSTLYAAPPRRKIEHPFNSSAQQLNIDSCLPQQPDEQAEATRARPTQ